mgnify:CR=1 FL=1
MKFKKDFGKGKIQRRIYSVLLSIMMMTNLMYGYTWTTNTSAVETKSSNTEKATYRNVMYYGDWSIYAGQKNFTLDKIDGSNITHLNFAFMDVNEDGDLITTDTWADYENPNVGFSVGSENKYAGVLGAMVLLRQKYPNMKIGISVGGWTRSGDFPKVASSDKTRKNFAKNVAKFVHYYGYDFVDIDWEYPTADRDPDPEGNGVAIDKGCKGSPADKHNFTLLLQAIRDELNAYDKIDDKHYELSVAMSAAPKMMSEIEYDQVLNIVDFANMMTYDLNGAWEGFTAHQTALYTNPAYDEGDAGLSVDSCIQFLEKNYGESIDYSKIVVGVAPYTRGWKEVKKNTGRDSKNIGLYADATGENGVTYAYGDINSLISKYKLKKYWDDKAKANYFYSEDTGYFFTCDTEESVAEKGKYVRSKHLGGLISWMASLDSTNSIASTMKESLYGSNALPVNDIKIPKNDGISLDIQTSGETYTLTLKNKNAVVSLPGGSKDISIMPWAENFGKTLSYPSLEIETTSGETLTGDWSAGGTISKENGNTVITPPEWSSKVVKPGDTLTFTLKSGSKSADMSKIKSIVLRQKAVSTGNIISRDVVYGSGISNITTAPVQSTEEIGTTNQQTVTVLPTTTQQSTATLPTTTQQTVTQNQTTSAQSIIGNYEEWSPNSVSYKVGDLVQYKGKVYECTYTHVSNVAWTPTEAFTLWKNRSDLVAGEIVTTKKEQSTEQPETTKKEQSTEQPETTDNNYTVNHKLPEHMVTGYWHNFLNGSKALRISDVPLYYDMICVAFANSTTTKGQVTFELDKDLSQALGGYSDADFIQDIKEAKAKGQHVIISVGGAEGTTYITDQESADRFSKSLITMIEKYGFEGVDIDFEGAAVSGTDYIAGALRKVHDYFGDDFIITMAPETYYMQADRLPATDLTTAYFRLATEIKDILTICYPQFYNSGGMIGYGGSNVSPGTADFLTSLSTLYMESGIRADQMALGVPSTSKAAGSGYVSNDIITKAVNALVNGTSSESFKVPKAYPTLRGVMTWSINWDATNGYAWAKEMNTLMKSLPKHEQKETEKNTENRTTETVINSTTKEQQTTENPIVPKPTEVVGLTIQKVDGSNVTFVWGQSMDQIASGQMYNVYIDGKYYQTFSNATSITYTFTSDGNHTILVKATLNGYETNGQSVEVGISGNHQSSANTETTVTPTIVPETVAPTTNNSETTVVTTTKSNVQPTTEKESVATEVFSRLMIGYYHTWGSSGNPFIRLRDVDSNWDVINVAFAEPVQAGSTDGKMQFKISGLSEEYTKNDFKEDIKDLQAKGKKIVLSIGGYEGYFSLTSKASVDQFVKDIKAIVDEYGFDGIDIDLEQSSVQFESGNDKDINNPTSPKVTNMISAIRQICDYYGDKFILSWAPETFYMQLGYAFYGGINQYCDSRAGVYLPMINALRNETTYVHVQLYNSAGITGLDGNTYNMGTKEGIVAMCEMLLKGFHVGAYYTNNNDASTYFAPLKPNQVVIGVPSSSGAAGSGQISNGDLQSAFSELESRYPGIRGIMSWSINWDASQNGNTFVKENAKFLEKMKKSESETTETPTTKIPETTEAPTTKIPETTEKKIIVSEELKVEGYQISTTKGGSRVIGSVEPIINNKKVTNWGFVYALAQKDNDSFQVEDDMYVGANNKYVFSIQSTVLGTIDKQYGPSSTATYFVRTTLFESTNSSEFSAKYKVRVYAQLSDGSYVYSKISSYSVYDIANILYQQRKMTNVTAHNYLYDVILKEVNKDYKKVDFDWSDEIVRL